MTEFHVRAGRALVVLWVLIALLGCGQKGPLRLPEPQSPPAAIDPALQAETVARAGLFE